MTLLIGLAVFAAAGIACAFAETIETLIALRFVQAVGACAGQVIARAIVRDTTAGALSAKVMSYIALAMSLSPAVTPSIGGFLQAHVGWYANFIFLGLIGLTLGVLAFVRLPETNRYPDPQATEVLPMLRNYRTLVRDRVYVGYVLCIGTIFGGLMSYQTGSPFIFMDTLGWSPQAYGLLILFNVLGFLSGSFLGTRIGARVGVPRMVTYGSYAILLAGLMMIAAPVFDLVSTVTMIVPMMVFLFGMGIGLPNAFTGAMASYPRIAGAAAALMGFVQMGLAMLASLAIGRIGGDMSWTMPAIFALCAVAHFMFRTILVGGSSGSGVQQIAR